MADVSRYVIMVSEPPYASLKPYTALRYARSAQRRGLDTRVVFFADGILCVKKGVGRGSGSVADFEQKVLGLIRDGIRVEACAAPLKLYALTPDDLVEGVSVADDVIGYTLEENTSVLWL